MTLVACEAVLIAAPSLRAARTVARAIAAARAARPARQRHDPGEGADPRHRAVRGLRVLRQADARAARGLEPPLEPRDAHLRASAERVFAGLFRRTPVRFSPWAVVLLVLAGLPAFLAEAKFSGEAFRLFRWRAPESRMQIYLESVLARDENAKEVKLFQPGTAVPRPLPRHLHPALPRGSRSHRTPRLLGLWPRPSRYRRALRRIRLDCRGNRARRHDRGTNDHVPHAAAAGTVGGERGAHRPSAACTRTTCIYRTCSSIWSSPWGARRRRHRGAAARRWHPLRGRRLRVSRRDAARARAHRSARAAGSKPRAGRRERLGQDHADQAADPALPARPAAGSCSTVSICRSGTRPCSGSASA